AHPVAERGDRLTDEEVAVARAPDEGRDAHSGSDATRWSRSKRMRLRYVCARGGGAGAFPTTRFTSMGTATEIPASAPTAPCVNASTGARAISATRAPTAVSPKTFPRIMPASRSTAPGQATTSSAPSAGEMPRPPAPRRNGDQLWPATATPPATRAPGGGPGGGRPRGPAGALGAL